jgi:hypothetical protein
MGDWFRQKSWNDEIEGNFFKKLARARIQLRPQYLKIQAIELIATQNPTALAAAEMLLQQFLADYPDNKIDRSASFKCLGDIYKLRGELMPSLEYYKKAIEYEAIYPNVQTDAYLDFAEIVIKLEKEALYPLVLSLILSRVENNPFPIEKYRSYSFLAIISFRKGELGPADQYSSLAAQSASTKQSDFYYHRDLGIVSEKEKWIESLLEKYKYGG